MKVIRDALRIIALIAAASVLLAACATIPQTSSKVSGMPAWVTRTPPPSGGYTYFVGSGSNPSGDLAKANESAIHSLSADVARYLGVNIKSETRVQTQGDLKSFETTMAESISETSSARVADFTVADRWIQHNGQTVTVFLLGKYATGALEREKTRIENLATERHDAIAVPEAKADALGAQHSVYQAAVLYMQAAAASARLGGENADVLFERNLKKAVDALGRIDLTVLRDNISGMIGQPLPEPFKLAVTAGNSNIPLAGVPFIGTYKVERSGGRSTTEVQHFRSGADGILDVTRPAPRAFGPGTIVVRLDVKAALEPLQGLPSKYLGLVGGLEQQVNGITATLRYTVSSVAATIPTGVLVMDLDRAGGRISGDDAASGIVQTLTADGYSILPIPSNASIVGIDNADLVTIVRNNYSPKIKRLVVGEAQITSFDQSDGSYLVEVSGKVEVADLSSGKVLYSVSQVTWSRAGGASSAIAAAFRSLGNSIGTDIANHLP